MSGRLCDANVVRAGVANDVNAIGFVGFAFVASSTANIKVVTIEGVDISDPSADPNTYALTRPLFNYYNGLFDAYKLAIQNQICFALSPEGQDVVTSVSLFSRALFCLTLS